MSQVSRNRPEARDRHTKLSQPGKTAVGLARIIYSEVEVGAAASCSCGWSIYHLRSKVAEDAIDRHLNKKHGGRGIRL